MTQIRRICVFCGSRLGRNGNYQAGAVALGKALAGHEIGLVYGGSSIGLMGVLADTVLDHGGEVIGVLPANFSNREQKHHKLTELHIVETMHERKALMADLADAFIAMPGGYGTLEEVLEQLTWNSIGLHSKPVGLLNVDRFFAPFIELIQHIADEGFLQQDRLQRLYIADTPDALLSSLNVLHRNIT